MTSESGKGSIDALLQQLLEEAALDLVTVGQYEEFKRLGKPIVEQWLESRAPAIVKWARSK